MARKQSTDAKADPIDLIDAVSIHLERINDYACVLRQLAHHDIVPHDRRQSVQLSMVRAIESSVDAARTALGGAA